MLKQTHGLTKAERNKAIAKEARQGKDYGKIAKKYCIHPYSIYRIFRDEGYKVSQRYAARNKEIVEQAKKGKKIKQLAKKFKLAFHSIYPILKAGGFTTGKIRSELQWEEQYNKLLQKARKEKCIPSAAVFSALGIYMPRAKLYRARLEKMGFKKIIRVRQKHFTHKELLNDLKTVAKRLKRTPSAEDIRSHGSYKWYLYRNYFGSLIKAQQLAGLKPNKLGRPKGKVKVLARLHGKNKN
jgi:Mor family transcriptional regulator